MGFERETINLLNDLGLVFSKEWIRGACVLLSEFSTELDVESATVMVDNDTLVYALRTKDDMPSIGIDCREGCIKNLLSAFDDIEIKVDGDSIIIELRKNICLH